jgi:hypothetical protein
MCSVSSTWPSQYRNLIRRAAERGKQPLPVAASVDSLEDEEEALEEALESTA